MHITSACLAGLAGAALTNALTLNSEKRDNPAVVKVPLKAKYGNSHARRLSKRDSIVESQFLPYAASVSYVGNISFGTPKQDFETYFSLWGTGSWLQGATGGYCSGGGDPMDCDGEGGYNKSASTTGKWLDETFNINNTDMGLAVSGEMVSDTLTFAGASMDNVNMPIIEGFSFASNQLSIGYGDDKNSTSLTRELASAGAIQSEAFSLYNSTILFGGVNKDKWEDELYTFPIINATSDNKPEHIAISIDGISINANDTLADEFPMSAILDNGYYMTYVPKSVAQSLNSQIKGASAPDAYGMVNLSCSAVNEGDMIQFRIGYLDLNLKLLDFINTVAWGSNHNPPTDKNKNETCYFQILEYTSLEDVGVYLGEKDVLLGDNFLRNVYSVFDLTNDEVSLASLNSDPLIGDNIVEITAGEVPGASPGDSDSAGVRIGEGLSTSALVATAAVLLFAL